jgi:peptide/nickel transport system permease protein
MLDPRQVQLPAALPSATQLEEASDVAFRQFSFRELTYRRFMAHPIAKWALVVLVLLAIACYGAPLWHALLPGVIRGEQQFTLVDVEQAPSLNHFFGTDEFLGFDIFSQVLYGGRWSLMIGVGSMALATVVGVVVGSVSGYIGGRVDALLMRITDVFLTVPVLLTVPMASKIFGHPGASTMAQVLPVLVIFGLLSWPQIARIVRSTFLSLREQQFAEAARALGTSSTRIMFRHLLPNSVGPIVVAFTLGIAFNIVLEAFVSFLGFGLRDPVYSWGSIISGAQGDLINGNWWWITFPGLAITTTVLCINFIGDGLRDALDPRIIN